MSLMPTPTSPLPALSTARTLHTWASHRASHARGLLDRLATQRGTVPFEPALREQARRRLAAELEAGCVDDCGGVDDYLAEHRDDILRTLDAPVEQRAGVAVFVLHPLFGAHHDRMHHFHCGSLRVAADTMALLRTLSHQPRVIACTPVAGLSNEERVAVVHFHLAEVAALVNTLRVFGRLALQMRNGLRSPQCPLHLEAPEEAERLLAAVLALAALPGLPAMETLRSGWEEKHFVNTLTADTADAWLVLPAVPSLPA